MELTIVLESGDGELWGRLRSENDFLLTTVGKNREEVTNNLKDCLVDFLAHEGKENNVWKNVKIEEIGFSYQYDLTAFFDIFKSLKISAIAEMAGLNASLLRQYAKGLTFASEKQVAKIQEAVRKLGKELMQVEFC